LFWAKPKLVSNAAACNRRNVVLNTVIVPPISAEEFIKEMEGCIEEAPQDWSRWNLRECGNQQGNKGILSHQQLQKSTPYK
jgi:hypothetical protein